MVERRNEAEIGAGRGHVDVAARLVGLRLHRERVAVLLVDRVLAEVVDRFAQPLDRVVRPPAGVGLGPFPAAPQHEDLRAELGAEVHRPQRLLDRIRAHPRVVGRERAVAEDRVVEQVHRRHRDDDVVLGAGGLEVLDDGVALARRRVDRHQIVVVEIDAPGADLAEHPDRIDRRQRRADHVAEGVTSPIADCPEAERKFVFRSGIVGVRHRGWAGQGAEPTDQITFSDCSPHRCPIRGPWSVVRQIGGV